MHHLANVSIPNPPVPRYGLMSEDGSFWMLQWQQASLYQTLGNEVAHAKWLTLRLCTTCGPKQLLRYYALALHTLFTHHRQKHFALRGKPKHHSSKKKTIITNTLTANSITTQTIKLAFTTECLPTQVIQIMCQRTHLRWWMCLTGKCIKTHTHNVLSYI